jgi:hypothetical protein
VQFFGQRTVAWTALRRAGSGHDALVAWFGARRYIESQRKPGRAPILVGPFGEREALSVTADPAVSRSTLHIDDSDPRIPLAGQPLGSVRGMRV